MTESVPTLAVRESSQDLTALTERLLAERHFLHGVKWRLLQTALRIVTLKLWSHNSSRLTHLSYNKDSGASHRPKFACSHNSHLVPQRKTEQNPLKESLLIHKSLCWNVSHYCVLCLGAKSAAVKQGRQENMKQIIADHAILTAKDECLKNCSLQWKAWWRRLEDAQAQQRSGFRLSDYASLSFNMFYYDNTGIHS